MCKVLRFPIEKARNLKRVKGGVVLDYSERIFWQIQEDIPDMMDLTLAELFVARERKLKKEE